MDNRWKAVRLRSALYRALRDYFDGSGFLEIETPILTPAPIPESHIELFATSAADAAGSEGRLYLAPSPEVWMKLALADGAPAMYQIARGFRNGEQLDKWHRWEFTMLEWYQPEIGAAENIPRMQEVLAAAAEATGSPRSGPIAGAIRVIGMEEAFRSHAGFSLEADLRNANLADTAASPAEFDAARSRAAEILSRRLAERNLPTGDGSEEPDDVFHRLYLALVESNLPADRPLILTDWPALVRTTAAHIPGTPWAERWELYLGGVETANCYREENRREALEEYWKAEARLKEQARVPAAADSIWVDRVARGMPKCSGTAVGLDRLLALLLGVGGLEGLDLFPLRDMMPQ